MMRKRSCEVRASEVGLWNWTVGGRGVLGFEEVVVVVLLLVLVVVVPFG